MENYKSYNDNRCVKFKRRKTREKLFTALISNTIQFWLDSSCVLVLGQWPNDCRCVMKTRRTHIWIEWRIEKERVREKGERSGRDRKKDTVAFRACTNSSCNVLLTRLSPGDMQTYQANEKKKYADWAWEVFFNKSTNVHIHTPKNEYHHQLNGFSWNEDVWDMSG